MLYFYLLCSLLSVNLDETYFLCNDGKLRIIGGNDKPRHKINCSGSRFSITILRIGSEVGVNDTLIFIAMVTKVHPSLRGKNLVTKYGLPEGYCMIPNKTEYMDDELWAKVVKVVAPGIRKIAVNNCNFFSLFNYLLT